MRLLNIFFILIILYLCYKIFIKQEYFNTNLSSTNLNFKKNLYVGDGKNNLGDADLSKYIDLTKNNLIINNNNNNLLNIKNKLCLGNNCLDKSQLELISGKVDAPQFMSDNKDVYYNHDCGGGDNISSSNPKHPSCIIDSSTQLPNKLCFKNNIDNERVDTCINSDNFDILLGNRGIKLKHLESNKNEIKFNEPTIIFIPIKIIVDNAHNSIFKDIFNNINKCVFNKLNIHFDITLEHNPSTQSEISINTLNTLNTHIKYEILIPGNSETNWDNKRRRIQEYKLTKKLLEKILDSNLSDDEFKKINPIDEITITTPTVVYKNKRKMYNIFYKTFINKQNGWRRSLLSWSTLEYYILDRNKERDLINKAKELMKGAVFTNDINTEDYDFNFVLDIFKIINDASKIKETKYTYDPPLRDLDNIIIDDIYTIDDAVKTAPKIMNIIYNDIRIVPTAKYYMNTHRNILYAFANKYGVNINTNYTNIINNLYKYKYDSWKESHQKSFTNDKYIMPYYSDFKQKTSGVKGTKDQLFFTNHNECVKDNTLYKLNDKFNPRKYPYFKSIVQESNCENVDCNDPLKSRLCLHKCSKNLLLQDLESFLKEYNKKNISDKKDNYSQLKYYAIQYGIINESQSESNTTLSTSSTTSSTISPTNTVDVDDGVIEDMYIKLRDKLLVTKRLWKFTAPQSLSKYNENINKLKQIQKINNIFSDSLIRDFITYIKQPSLILLLPKVSKLYTSLSSRISDEFKLSMNIERLTNFTNYMAKSENEFKALKYLNSNVQIMIDTLERRLNSYKNIINEDEITNPTINSTLLTYKECTSLKANYDITCRTEYVPTTASTITENNDTNVIPETITSNDPDSSLVLEDTIINDTGEMNGIDWHRICADENILEHSNYIKGKKIYCLNSKSKDYNNIKSDEKEPTSNAGRDKGRQGGQKYGCDGRPNWSMENLDYGGTDAKKRHIMNYELQNKNKWPEVMLYGFDKLGRYDDGSYSKTDNNNWLPDNDNDKEMPKIDKTQVIDYITNIGIPKLNSQSSSRDRRINNRSDEFKSGGVIEQRTRPQRNWLWGSRRRRGARWNCCSCLYGYGTGRNKGSCKKGSYKGFGNKVNTCIKDYNSSVNFMNEYDIKNDIGYYILPDEVEIDPTYEGYYIDAENNNLKYIIKSNALATSSKFLGNLDNHRVTHNGICGESDNDLSNTKFFCAGKNKNNPQYDKICNPSTYRNNIINTCVNNKKADVAEADADAADADAAAPPKLNELQILEMRQGTYTRPDIPEQCVNNDSEKQNMCINELKVKQSILQNEYIQECIGEMKESDDTLESSIFTPPENIDDYYDLNYFIEPAKNKDGELLEANGYFHSHKHIHK